MLILGSSSPRRSALLCQVGAEFAVRVAPVDESLSGTLQPMAYVSTLSHRKAAAVSAMIANERDIWVQHKRAIVIGADTIVVAQDGSIMGKPASRDDARRMLKALSGKWHEVYTGVALISAYDPGLAAPNAPRRTGRTANPYDELIGREVTRVKMGELDAATIDMYVNTGESDGKAGAYAIQGAGSLFIERVEGCYFNIVGLPLRLLWTMLGNIGYDLLKKKFKD